VLFRSGDYENQCFVTRLQEVVDTATGTVMPLWEWAGGTYNDLMKWSSKICGMYTGEDGCINARQCTWCGSNSQCYVYASYSNPCGNVEAGILTVKNWWNSVFGRATSTSSCSLEKINAYENLREARGLAISNLRFACTTYDKRQIHLQRLMTAVDAAGNWTLKETMDMVEVNMNTAQQSMTDAMSAINESADQEEMMLGFQLSNPCLNQMSNLANGSSGATGLGVPSLALLAPVAFALF